MERAKLTKIFHETAGRGITHLKDQANKKKIEQIKPGEHLVSTIPPYVSQLADAKPESIEKFYGKIQDKEAMRRFGAKDLNEFSYWAWRSCGIAGIQSILSATDNEFEKKTMDLITECLELGGYDISSDTGWFHNALVKLAKKYRVDGNTKKFVPTSEMALEILNNKYVLASMKSDTGGHLLLLYGFKIDDQGRLEGFIHHDPNSYLKYGEANFISKSDFDKLTTRRIISFNSAR